MSTAVEQKLIISFRITEFFLMTQENVRPYLFFGGRCEEALEFYKSTVGAEVEMLMRFNESPEPPPPGMVPDGFESKIMHATFRIGESTIMASDGCGQESKFEGFSLAISAADEPKVRQMFESLAAGGTVTMPLEKTFWSSLYGMLTDRFGISWMVMVTPPNS